MKCARCSVELSPDHSRYCSKACRDISSRMPLEQRLWARVNRSGPNDCWEWIGHRMTNGYAALHRGAPARGMIYAHRAAWLVTYGALPPKVMVCHSCDNPLCCNPRHLFLGTQAENMRDAAAKGRIRHGKPLTAERRAIVRALAPTLAQRAIAIEAGVSVSSVARVLRGRR